MRHRKILNVIIIIVCVAFFGYFAIRTKNLKDVKVEVQVYSGKAMGTAVKKTIYAENIQKSDEVDKVIDTTLSELEKQISVRNTDSEISKMNRSYAADGVYKVSDNILEYLEVEMQIYKETNGAFSPCIRPITALWGIEDGGTAIPDEALIEESVRCSNADDMEVVEGGITFKRSGMAIDLGAAGKGIACDVIKKQLYDAEITGAVVSVGGSILVYGDKGDGRKWHIGIQNPRGATGDVLGVVDIEGDVMISTSGDYEKYFEQDGKRYHHIFNPKTGYPADSGLISVTIVCDNGLLSDALSTACFVMGLEDGMAYAEEKGVGAIFVTMDKKVYVTKNLKKAFRLQAEGYELEK